MSLVCAALANKAVSQVLQQATAASTPKKIDADAHGNALFRAIT